MPRLLRDFGEYLLLETRGRFDREQTPDGEAWAALNPRYKRQKKRKRLDAGILKATLALRDNVLYQVSGNELEMGSDRTVRGIDLGALHQFGTKRGIPAREWLGINWADEVEFEEIIADWLRL